MLISWKAGASCLAASCVFFERPTMHFVAHTSACHAPRPKEIRKISVHSDLACHVLCRSRTDRRNEQLDTRMFTGLLSHPHQGCSVSFVTRLNTVVRHRPSGQHQRHNPDGDGPNQEQCIPQVRAAFVRRVFFSRIPVLMEGTHSACVIDAGSSVEGTVLRGLRWVRCMEERMSVVVRQRRWKTGAGRAGRVQDC